MKGGVDYEAPYRIVERPQRVRLSDSIADQIEQLIVDGKLRPGHPLPAERVLAPKLSVSRASLREALLKLEARGLVSVAANGRFAVSDVTAPTITDPLVHLMRGHPRAGLDVIEMRQGLEMVAAYYAAERATREDRLRLRRAVANMEAVHRKRDALADAEADAQFHITIAEASHNVALIHVMRGIYNLLRVSMHHAWEVMYCEPNYVRMLHDQHRALLDAILAADGTRAKDAAHVHLSYVRETLQQLEPRAATRPARAAKSRK